MPIETLIGTPDPEDPRTPEEKYADHLTDIARDHAAEERRRHEWGARIVGSAAVAANPAEIDKYLGGGSPHGDTGNNVEGE